ncbi:hypothetical protein SFRURICE_007326 [Spodoptera frugiperda]|nr:hypothetical protein SFRURICE_007326 [Spodoptera frugiperda]
MRADDVIRNTYDAGLWTLTLKDPPRISIQMHLSVGFFKWFFSYTKRQEELFHQRCAMLRCCGCFWLPPIILSLALVETDSAKRIWLLYYRYIAQLHSLVSVETLCVPMNMIGGSQTHLLQHSIAHLWRSTLM